MPENIGPLSLSKREHLAALILAGMCANYEFNDEGSTAMAKTALARADALIDALAYSAAEIESPRVVFRLAVNVGYSSPDPEDVAMEKLRERVPQDSHQEFYRPSGSTELVEIPESPELDALRNELYSAEILLGGGEDE